MARRLALVRYFLSIVFFSGLFSFAIAQDKIIAKVELKEIFGLKRHLEYIEIEIQLAAEDISDDKLYFVAQNEAQDQIIPCQVIERKNFKTENTDQIRLIFPVSLNANHAANYLIKSINEPNSIQTDLSFTGQGFELIIDNAFYRADLTKSNQSEAKSHESGQLRELLVKMNHDVLLLRTENRMHWAPNFQNQRVEYYKTIAGWERPENYQLMAGPYLIRTIRSDKAPQHEEILLSANYSFYAGLPYFKFFSSMVIERDIVLSWLWNDEMTMDSLFTHVAFQKRTGEIVDLNFGERHKTLDLEPIENEAPWLCFYNVDRGYAFGSIRIKYDISNNSGLPSPNYRPHTKISNGAGGGKYWNRRLIDNQPTIVPVGSSYIEENAYIVFKIDKEDRFSEIRKWSERIRSPLQVKVEYIN